MGMNTWILPDLLDHLFVVTMTIFILSRSRDKTQFYYQSDTGLQRLNHCVVPSTRSGEVWAWSPRAVGLVTSWTWEAVAAWWRNCLKTSESDWGTSVTRDTETDTQDLICFAGNIPPGVYSPLEICLISEEFSRNSYEDLETEDEKQISVVEVD